MSDFETASIAAQLTASVIAAHGRIAAASVRPGTAQITVNMPALTAAGAVEIFKEIAAGLGHSGHFSFG